MMVGLGFSSRVINQLAVAAVAVAGQIASMKPVRVDLDTPAAVAVAVVPV